MKKNKMLIVDDEKNFLTILENILVDAGYETITTRRGNDVLDLVKRHRPDIVLLDIVMPDIDGLRVKELMNKDKLTHDVPVVFVTVKHEVEQKIRGFNLGAYDYIVKPFDPSELLARIHSILERRSFYEKIAMTDGLTGLYNVSFFKNQLALFFKTAQRYREVFSLAIIDVDDFKKINDTHGHVVGDFVLKTFAAIAKTTIRSADVVIRYGGDEFAIILPVTNLKQATHTMHRLIKGIKGKSFAIPNSRKKLSFSVSLGITTYDAHFNNEIEMFDDADQKLYDVKRQK